MNNRVRICLLLSNLAYPFVSSIGVKLTLPNFFVLPVCLMDCSLDGKILSLLLLVTWCCSWFIFFRNKPKFLRLILCQTILIIHITLLAYEALLARSMMVLLSANLLPSYTLVVCYLFINYEYYLFRSEPKLQNSK